MIRALSAALLASACAAAPYPAIQHPLAASGALGVRDAQHEATFERLAHDPRAEREAVLQLVVRVTVEYRGGLAHGSGIVLCQAGRDLYVLTARHVLTGAGRPGRETGQKRFAWVSGYTFTFYRNALPALSGPLEQFYVREVPEADLALVRARLPEDSLRLPRLRVGRARALAPGDRVRTVGFSLDEQTEWLALEGSVAGVGAGTLSYLPGVSQGYSGGPVLDPEDRLVGINTHVERDGNAARTHALPAEDALGHVRKWVASACPDALS